MTATLPEPTTIDAFMAIARFAARAGVPLPKTLTAEVTGTDQEALAELRRTEELLAGSAVSYERDDTGACHRLVIHAGAGVTLTLFHQRRPQSLSQRIEEKEAEVAWLEEMYAGLRDGIASWREWNDELTCAGRQDVAAEECGMALDDARAELARMTQAAARPGDGD